MKKKFLVGLAIGFLVFGMVGVANATIVDLPDDVNGIGYFSDTVTGYTWLDTDSIIGLSYNQLESQFAGTIWQIAKYDDLRAMHQQLINDITYPLVSNFWHWANIMGMMWEPNLQGIQTPYIQGQYDNEDTTKLTVGHSWEGVGEADWTYLNPVPNDRDFVWQVGVWAFTTEAFNSNSPVPVPSTILLLGFGLVGLAGVARKKGDRGQSKNY